MESSSRTLRLPRAVRAAALAAIGGTQIQGELATLARESAAAETWLASSEAYEEANRERLQAALKRRGEVTERVAALEADWLRQQAELEKKINGVRDDF